MSFKDAIEVIKRVVIFHTEKFNKLDALFRLRNDLFSKVIEKENISISERDVLTLKLIETDSIILELIEDRTEPYWKENCRILFRGTTTEKFIAIGLYIKESGVSYKRAIEELTEGD